MPALESSAEPDSSAGQRQPLEDLHVLVVDDNQGMRELLKEILVGLGVRSVRDAADAASAVARMVSFPPDIIFVDRVMEPVDGIEFIRRIRSGKDGDDRFVPIVLVTAHTESDGIYAARDAGVTEILAKPISIEAVWSRLVAIIEHPRAFIETSTYFGPDRRRQDRPHGGSDRRSFQDPMTQSEIDAVMQSVPE